jgi:hypothetical protein
MPLLLEPARRFRKAVDEAAAYAVDKAEEVRISATETITQKCWTKASSSTTDRSGNTPTGTMLQEGQHRLYQPSLGADFVIEFIGQVK